MIPGILVGLAAGIAQLVLLKQLTASLMDGRATKTGLYVLMQSVVFIALVVLAVLFWRAALVWSAAMMVAVMILGSFIRFALMSKKSGKGKNN